MAKAKATKPSLLELAKASPRVAPSWHSRMKPEEYQQVNDVVDAFIRGDLPTWTLTYLYDWLQKPEHGLETFQVGKTQFIQYVRARKEGTA